MTKTELYRPSNSSEGEIFMGLFCSRCERDAAHRADPMYAEGCPIIANALAFAIGDPEYPKEWVRDVDSELGLFGAPGARCTAFVLEGDKPIYRCPNTKDLFE